VAVASDDTKTLTRVSGIGQKGAQRIILELKDRLGTPVGHVRNGTPARVAAPWKDQVLQGLVGLGWSAKDADAAVEAVAPEAGDDPQVAALLRSALRTMSKA
jgi:Holliday junction DNA helicase RuvA